MPAAFQILSTQAIARYIAPLVDRRQNPVPDNLTMLKRTPDVERTDGELAVAHNAYVLAADIIADDQQAIVKQMDTFTPQTNKIPNLKHGTLITQEMLNFLNRINAGNATPGDENIFRRYIARKLDDLIKGIRTRKEALLWQMALGSSSYSGYGIQWSGVTFGIPSDLLVTPSVPWATSGSATPLTDIQTLQQTAQAKYGKVYNRIEMSLTAFNNMTATTEFKNRAQLFSGFTFPAGSFPNMDLTLMTNMAGRLLNMTIELNDFQYSEMDASGQVSYSRFLPVTKVRLSNTADDNNAAARDFGQTVVTESLIGNLPGVNIFGGGGLGSARTGPIGYATPRSDLNPPNIILWAVDRGFPEKNDRTESAVLTVG